MKRFILAALLIALLLAVPLVWLTPAEAQSPPAATLDPRPTLPPTWTLTPTRLPTETPRPIPSITPSITPSPPPTVFPLPPAPEAARVEGMRLVWQEYNGCAAAALTMLLYYQGWNGSRDSVARGIKPSDADVSVRGIEMVSFVESQGYKAVVRSGGTLDVLRWLVAAGYPVLVENVYNPGGEDWMGHNRVIMGYDDRTQTIYAYDSVLGSGEDDEGRAFTYAEFDALWKPFNRTYLVAYPAEDEGRIQVILGPHWNATENAVLALDEAMAELARDPGDAFSRFNLGTALLTLGRAEEAITAFEAAMGGGLPWRYLWYQFGPFEAYLLAGRYDQVIALGEDVLRTTQGVEEVYYYLGQAYAALGDPARATANFQAALTRNPHFLEAELALGRVSAGQ